MKQRTRPGRLAVTQRWVAHAVPELVAPGSTVVDFGFGESPVTTLEWAEALGSTVRVIGIDKAWSESVDQQGVRLIRGDFSSLPGLAPVTLVRAMNVLRGFTEPELASAHAALGGPLVDGGAIIDGSSDTEGDVTVAGILRKRGPVLRREALIFHTTFTRGFAPWLFRDWLPRDLRRSAKPGTAIFEFLTQWHQAFEATSGRLADRFTQSARALPDVTSWEPGAICWHHPPDVV